MSPHILNATVIAIGFFSASCAVGGFLAGRYWTWRRHRNDYPDGFDAGQDGERQRWETITGRSYEDVKALLRDRPLPVRAPLWREPEPAGDGPPPAGELLAEADTLIQRHQAEAGQRAADITGRAAARGDLPQMAAAPVTADVPLPLAEPGPPVVADITSAAAMPTVMPSRQVAAYARLARVRAESQAFLARTDARCDAFLSLMRAETAAFLAGLGD